jgi:hypothetical protein
MFAPPATGEDAGHSFRLHKFMQEIGREGDTFVTTPDGTTEAKSSFSFRDRGWTVALSARVELARDGALISYAIWGDTSRLSKIDERVQLRSDGAYDVTRDGKRTRVELAPGAVVASGYAPMLVQELVLQTWRARGKPASMPLASAASSRSARAATRATTCHRARSRSSMSRSPASCGASKMYGSTTRISSPR